MSVVATVKADIAPHAIVQRDVRPLFRFGSEADITRLLSNVRFAPQSGQSGEMLAMSAWCQ